MMRGLAFLLPILLLLDAVAFGQYGTAPNGYYPSRYNGEIISGRVTAVDEVAEQITISFEKAKKTETFVGRLDAPCAVPSKDGKPMTALDLPVGTDVTAFFVTSVPEDKNSSEKENSIIGIMFHSWNGRPVKPQSKKMYLCSRAPISHNFRCFETPAAGCRVP